MPYRLRATKPEYRGRTTKKYGPALPENWLSILLGEGFPGITAQELYGEPTTPIRRGLADLGVPPVARPMPEGLGLGGEFLVGLGRGARTLPWLLEALGTTIGAGGYDIYQHLAELQPELAARRMPTPRGMPVQEPLGPQPGLLSMLPGVTPAEAAAPTPAAGIAPTVVTPTAAPEADIAQAVMANPEGYINMGGGSEWYLGQGLKIHTLNGQVVSMEPTERSLIEQKRAARVGKPSRAITEPVAGPVAEPTRTQAPTFAEIKADPEGYAKYVVEQTFQRARNPDEAESLLAAAEQKARAAGIPEEETMRLFSGDIPEIKKIATRAKATRDRAVGGTAARISQTMPWGRMKELGLTKGWWPRRRPSAEKIRKFVESLYPEAEGGMGGGLSPDVAESLSRVMGR